MAGNTAFAEGGAVYLVNNKALTINGGYISNLAADGTTRLSGNTASGINGGAINIGKGNDTSDVAAKLYFERNVIIYDNGAEDLEGEIAQKNVVLDKTSSNQNSVNAIINTTAEGLTEDAHIGIYVTGNDGSDEKQKTDPFKSHGNEADPFGTYAAIEKGSENLACFTNDRVDDLFGIVGSGKNAQYIVWGAEVIGFRKVILKKVGYNNVALEGAKFKLSKEGSDAAFQLKKEDGTSETLDETKLVSTSTGIIWIGELPYGTYYLEEKTAPTKHLGKDTTDYRNNNGKWFCLIVDDTGVWMSADGYKSEKEKAFEDATNVKAKALAKAK
jgi:hypothetical protein